MCFEVNSKINNLKIFPRIGLLKNYEENIEVKQISVKIFIISYQILEKEIIILSFYHTSRNIKNNSIIFVF